MYSTFVLYLDGWRIGQRNLHRDSLHVFRRCRIERKTLVPSSFCGNFDDIESEKKRQFVFNYVFLRISSVVSGFVVPVLTCSLLTYYLWFEVV